MSPVTLRGVIEKLLPDSLDTDRKYLAVWRKVKAYAALLKVIVYYCFIKVDDAPEHRRKCYEFLNLLFLLPS